MALVTGLAVATWLDSARVKLLNWRAVTLAAILMVDLHVVYRFRVSFTNSGITAPEYKAAVWFRENSSPASRIVADYYRVQLVAGVCGGKALLGALFPLRNVTIPYINEYYTVQKDIGAIYTTSDPKTASDLMKKYRCDYVFLSNTMKRGGAFGVAAMGKPCGLDINSDKFLDQNYFEVVYYDENTVCIVKKKD